MAPRPLCVAFRGAEKCDNSQEFRLIKRVIFMRHVHAERHELLHRRAQLPEELRGALLPAQYGRPGVRPKLTRRSAREQARAFHSHFHTTMFICLFLASD